jgi:hypothetical protein
MKIAAFCFVAFISLSFYYAAAQELRLKIPAAKADVKKMEYEAIERSAAQARITQAEKVVKTAREQLHGQKK